MGRMGTANKYGAVRTRGFASKLEADRHDQLRILELSGAIVDLEFQHRFEVQPEGCAKIRYTPDATYRDIKGIFGPPRALVCEDCKGGVASRDFNLRAKLFVWRYPQYRLLIVKRAGRGFSVAEFK